MTAQSNVDGKLEMLRQWRTADSCIVQATAMCRQNVKWTPDVVTRRLQRIHKVRPVEPFAAMSARHFGGCEIGPPPRPRGTLDFNWRTNDSSERVMAWPKPTIVALRSLIQLGILTDQE